MAEDSPLMIHYNLGWCDALLYFAKLLDDRRPSVIQESVGSKDYNAGAIAALQWASKEAILQRQITRTALADRSANSEGVK